MASAGIRSDAIPGLALEPGDLGEECTELTVPGLEHCPAMALGIAGEPPSTLVVARAAGGEFALHELHLARGMARVLGLSLRHFRLAAEERRQRREAEQQSALNQRLLDSLQERQDLLERLARIQRSITRGAVREDVLDAICLGARELLGDDVAGLRLVPRDDPSVLEVVAVSGIEAGVLRPARPDRRGAERPRDGGGPARRDGGLPGLGQRLAGVRPRGHRGRHGRAGARARQADRQRRGRIPPPRAPLQLDRARHPRRVRRPREPRALRHPQDPGAPGGRRRADTGALQLAREELVGHDHGDRLRTARSCTPAPRWSGRSTPRTAASRAPRSRC